LLPGTASPSCCDTKASRGCSSMSTPCCITLHNPLQPILGVKV
jgi:hypothetical protein